MSATAEPMPKFYSNRCIRCGLDKECAGHETGIPITGPPDGTISIQSCWPVVPTGWRCPGCGACYAPHVGKCWTCGTVTLTTTSTGGA